MSKTYYLKFGPLVVTVAYNSHPAASMFRIYQIVSNFGLLICYGLVIAWLYGDPYKAKLALEAMRQTSCKREGG